MKNLNMHKIKEYFNWLKRYFFIYNLFASLILPVFSKNFFDVSFFDFFESILTLLTSDNLDSLFNNNVLDTHMSAMSKDGSNSLSSAVESRDETITNDPAGDSEENKDWWKSVYYYGGIFVAGLALIGIIYYYMTSPPSDFGSSGCFNNPVDIPVTETTSANITSIVVESLANAVVETMVDNAVNAVAETIADTIIDAIAPADTVAVADAIAPVAPVFDAGAPFIKHDDPKRSVLVPIHIQHNKELFKALIKELNGICQVYGEIINPQHLIYNFKGQGCYLRVLNATEWVEWREPLNIVHICFDNLPHSPSFTTEEFVDPHFTEGAKNLYFLSTEYAVNFLMSNDKDLADSLLRAIHEEEYLRRLNALTESNRVFFSKLNLVAEALNSGSMEVVEGLKKELFAIQYKESFNIPILEELYNRYDYIRAINGSTDKIVDVTQRNIDELINSLIY